MVRFEIDVDWHRAAWIGLGAVLALAIVWVVYSFVGTFVFGIFIYYATRRLYRRVRRRIRPPSLAAAVSLGLLALPALALLSYTLVIGLQQLSQFTAAVGASESFEPYLAMVGPYLELSEGIGDPQALLSDLVENPEALLSNAGGFGTATDALGTVLGSLGILFTGLLHLFVMLALAFYLLRDGPKMSRWLSNFTDVHGVLDEYAREVDRSLDKVFYGNILNAAITGTIGAIAYSVLNVVAPGPVQIPYAVLIGLLTGIASLIPVVGMKLIYVPMTAYLAALTAFDGGAWWFVGLFVAVSFLLVDTIPDLVVRPYVSGGSLHVGALMFAYILGPLLWGWYGIFLGPILLVLVVHFARIVAPELLTGRPIEPYSVDPSNLVDPTPTSPPQSDSGTPSPEGTDGGQSEAASDSEE